MSFKSIFILYALVIGLFLIQDCFGEERVQGQFGPSLQMGQQYGSVAYQQINGKGQVQEIKLCTYHENDPKRSYNPWMGCGFYSLGLEAGTNERIVVQGLYGIGILTTTDPQLGGVFPQFQGEASIFYQDLDTRNRIGVSYVHTSSATVVTPNLGKDSVVFTLSMPIGK